MAATSIVVQPMADADWPEVRRIYAEGIATGDATLEREAPDWTHFDHSHRHDCRLVARSTDGRPVLGWTALTAYSSRRVYAGVAWESVYVAAARHGQGVGRALLDAAIAAAEAAGFWALMAGILAENAASVALHEPAGFRRVGVLERIGRDASGRWRDVVLMQRGEARPPGEMQAD